MYIFRWLIEDDANAMKGSVMGNSSDIKHPELD